VLDATVTNETLNVRYRVKHIPDGIVAFQLKITATPSIFSPLKDFGEGDHSISLRLTQTHAALRTRPFAVSIWGQDIEPTLIDLGCNELWVINADELHAQMMNTAIVSIGSGGYLAEGVVASDVEWSELYKTLAELIELDIAGLSRKGGTYTATSRKKPPSPKPGDPEKETNIHLIEAEALTREQADTEGVDIERLIFEESRFGAWLEYINGRLSGASEETTEPGEEDEDVDARAGDTHKRGDRSKSPRTRHSPDPRIGKRFINLVQKYIRSLHNVAYMQSIPLWYILTYFTVFQRIVWLLLEHEVIDRDEFARLVLKMNIGFFGSKSESAPLCTFRLNRHIRRVWQTEWQKYDVGQYALVSMELALRWIEQSETASRLKAQVTGQTARILASIALVMDVQSLTEDIKAWVQVAKVYQQDEGELAAQMKERIISVLPETLTLLKHWNLRVNIETLATTDPNLVKYLQREQLDYQLAEYRFRKRLGQTDGIFDLCSEVLSRAWQLGDLEVAAELEEDYVNLAEALGQFQEVAQTLYKQGEKLCRDKQFMEAYDKLQRALAISQSIEDSKLVAACERVLDRVEFFLS